MKSAACTEQVEFETFRFADVATELQTRQRERLLTYRIPEHLSGRVLVRGLVWVPLRRSHKVGVVVALHDDEPDFEARDVQALVEPGFQLTPEQWRLVEWISHETICTLYDASTPFFPPGATTRAVEHLVLGTGAKTDTPDLTSLQQQLVVFLEERGEVSLDVARRALGSRLTSVVPALEERGLVERAVRVRATSPKARKTRLLRRTVHPAPNLDRAPAQRRALQVLERRLRLSGDAPVPWSDLTRHIGVNNRALNELVRRELAEVETIALPQPSLSGDGRTSRLVRLNDAQSAAWRRLHTSLRTGDHREFLLHGITGSGKTELYLRAAAWYLSRGRGVLILVPEIALASQMSQRIAERFPGRAAIIHSNLPESERYHIWRSVKEGRIPVVVGPRSALFSPAPDIGLIVLDEEHDPAYKQGQVPRYHARDVARKIARQHGALLVLGSATPDVQTFKRANEGEIEHLELPHRVARDTLHSGNGHRPPALELPNVDVVDMREELRGGNTGLFSRRLIELLEATLTHDEQAILYLNRRGAATFIQCRSCGFVLECPHCDIPLVYHPDRRRALCHRCNYQVHPPVRCPDCGLNTVSYYGSGTQRVEREARRLFPSARILRWDRDAIRRGNTHDQLMNRVLGREVDIVVGTQLVAKGFDFPDVMTIGVMNADGQLHLPDFRSGERTFQLLMQVAGRAGRRVAGSEVVFQTYSPDHYAIQTASEHDYTSFAREELAFRQFLRYPPYSRLVRLLYRHRDDLEARMAAEDLADHIHLLIEDGALCDVEVLGPTPAFIARIRDHFQWQIVLRGEASHDLAALAEIPAGWLIDVDPISMI